MSGVVKSYKITDRLRKYIQLPRDDGQRCLIIWWGSIRGAGATAGDCLAVTNLALGLKDRGERVEVAAFHDLRIPGVQSVHPASANPKRYRAVCFVCGPIRSQKKLIRLVRTYQRCRRVAAGVSVIRSEPEILAEFDDIVPRDGASPAYFDLALADPWRQIYVKPVQKRDHIATCFRGAQVSIGLARDAHHEYAEKLLITAANEVNMGKTLLNIDTHANTSMGIDAVIKAFSCAELVFTTRLHGALLALELDIPFVAVDQINGGHKVSEVLGKIGWPFVFRVNDTGLSRIREAVNAVRQPEFESVLQNCRARAVSEANDALIRACNAVQS